MKIDKVFFRKIIIGIIFIILLFYIFFLKEQINSYEKEIFTFEDKSKVDKVTINKYTKSILELEDEIQSLKELNEETNEIVNEKNRLIDFYASTVDPIDIIKKVVENNFFHYNKKNW